MNMKKTIAFFALILFAGSAKAQQTNPLLQHENEITEIIKGMTLEEKVNMLHGKNMFSSTGILPYRFGSGSNVVARYCI